jgi:hypothetical protein
MERDSAWITIDQSVLNLPKRRKINGADVMVMVPPQDFPEAFQCRLDDVSRTYTIEFRYASNAPEKPRVVQPAGQPAQFLVGGSSGRLLRVVIPYDGETPEAAYLMTALQSAADSLANLPKPVASAFWGHRQTPRAGNYRATSSVIDSKRDEIIGLLGVR